MAYTRLNKRQRTNIVKRLMEKNEKNFKDETDAIAIERSNLSFEVYKHLVGPEYDALQDLPEDWFTQRTQVLFCIGYDQHRLNFNEPGTPENQTQKFPMPLFMSQHYGGPKLAPSNALAKRVKALVKRERKVTDDRNKASREISSVVNSYTTAKQLVEAWPEIEGIVLGATATTKNPTSKVTRNLNVALGLAS